MDTPTSRIIEEAVAAIKRGEVSLATGADRYGKTWAEIEPQVRLELTLDKAAQTFKTSLPPLDLDRMWGKIEQGMGQNRATSAADSGSLPGVEANPFDLPKITVPATIKSATPARPAKLPIKLSNWRRKPLSWAAAFLIFLTVSFSSAAGIAQAAEPGDNLYDFKVWLDGAGQAFALSADNKAQAALSYADHRLNDIEHAARQGRLQYIPAVVDKYGDAIETARQSANNSWSQEQRLVLEQQQAKLTEIKNTLPANPEAVSVGQDLDQARMKLVMPPPPQSSQAMPTATPTLTTRATATVAATATTQPSPTPTTADPTTVSPGGSKNSEASLPGWAKPAITTLPVSTPTAVPTPATDERNRDRTTVPATPTPIVLAQPPTAIPPTAVPPTAIAPTAIPPTAVPPTAIPPTAIPPTAVPPTAVLPTAIPTTLVPPTAIPTTLVPTTTVRPTAVPVTTVRPTVVPPTAVPITITVPSFTTPAVSVPSITTPAITTPSLTDSPKTEPAKPNTPDPNTPNPNTPDPNTPNPNTPNPNTPNPNTPAPQSPSPNTSAPQTPSPNTPAPQSPSPNTPSPNTPNPNTPNPNTPSPNTPAPEAPGPNTPAPQSPNPNTPAPQTPGPNSPRLKES